MNVIEQEKLYQKRKDPDIRFMFKSPDEWGYFTNIHNPKVREEYDNFIRQRNIPYFAPLSDDERHEFDCLMMNRYKDEWRQWRRFSLMTGGQNERESFISVRNGLEICEADSA
ncbi:MAG: hypothetical protein U0K91_01780 [Acutalibacteraceae bacterium]|nr:hypothetical protein [Acutalibacteraceae bacterium]